MLCRLRLFVTLNFIKLDFFYYFFFIPTRSPKFISQFTHTHTHLFLAVNASATLTHGCHPHSADVQSFLANMFILPTTKGKPYVYKGAVFLSLAFNTNSCPQQQQQRQKIKYNRPAEKENNKAQMCTGSMGVRSWCLSATDY